MYISQTLQWAIKHLRTSDSPNLDSEVLLSFVLKKSKEFLFAHPEKKLTNLKLKTYKLLIARRAKHEPVAYLTGHKEFYGLDFKVSPATLIPRPETELIIETLKHLNTKTLKQLNNLTIIDVGTGSGCIPIALATTLRARRGGRSNPIRFFATDISKSALAIAKKNAQHHNVKIKFLRGNLLEPFISNFANLQISNLIVIANLPYLTKKQYQAEPSIRFEPKIALVGGKDGLKYYRELFCQLSTFVIPTEVEGSFPLLGKEGLGEVDVMLLLEIDPAQTKKILRLIKKNFPKARVEIKKDLAGRGRVAVMSGITCG